jgi:hypothetical protein
MLLLLLLLAFLLLCRQQLLFCAHSSLCRIDLSIHVFMLADLTVFRNSIRWVVAVCGLVSFR